LLAQVFRLQEGHLRLSISCHDCIVAMQYGFTPM